MTEEERFTTALHHAYRGWRAALDRRMRDLGISQAGWVAVAYVAKADAPLSQSELANLVQVEAATMVSTLDRLEKAGLVERVASETDRRVKNIRITPAGQAIYDQVRDRADALRHEVIGRLPPDKLVQAAELLETLQSLIENS
jgi:MarR family transcriptional regulator for hemolysin